MTQAEFNIIEKMLIALIGSMRAHDFMQELKSKVEVTNG